MTQIATTLRWKAFEDDLLLLPNREEFATYLLSEAGLREAKLVSAVRYRGVRAGRGEAMSDRLLDISRRALEDCDCPCGFAPIRKADVWHVFERIRRLELALASTLETSPLSGLAPSRVLTGTETNADVAALEELQRLR